MFKMLILMSVMIFSLSMGIATAVSGMVQEVRMPSANRYASSASVLQASEEAGNILQPQRPLEVAPSDSADRLFVNLVNPQEAGRNGL